MSSQPQRADAGRTIKKSHPKVAFQEKLRGNYFLTYLEAAEAAGAAASEAAGAAGAASTAGAGAATGAGAGAGASSFLPQAERAAAAAITAIRTRDLFICNT
ncbi:hypothetical protein [Rhodoferax sp.]|uniref:hypothetical protein n=1 Tax=Rhodoferax sp. TaxID=50421 RepID=UPI0025D1CFA3|nr:hypothetical protein [Rhodoferax sp.]